MNDRMAVDCAIKNNLKEMARSLVGTVKLPMHGTQKNYVARFAALWYTDNKMTHERRGRITAVAFDIDGTLYPQRALFWRMSGHFMRHCIFFLHYGIIRKQIRTLPVQDDFYRTQNELLAARLRCTPEDAQKKLREIVYDGLAPYFKRIKPFPGVLETFKAFYDAGLKLGVL